MTSILLSQLAILEWKYIQPFQLTLEWQYIPPFQLTSILLSEIELPKLIVAHRKIMLRKVNYVNQTWEMAMTTVPSRWTSSRAPLQA